MDDGKYNPGRRRREHRRMVFMNDSLPCLDLLEGTPAILRGLMSGISEEDLEEIAGNSESDPSDDSSMP